MKKTYVRIIPFLFLCLAACEFAGISINLGGEEAVSAMPIEVGIDSPSNNAELQMAPVEIAYHASSPEGVAAVELSIDGIVVSSIETPASEQEVVALKYVWNPADSGAHTIRVRAQSSGGAWSDYSGISITLQGTPQQGQEQPQVAQQESQVPQTTHTPEPTATPEGVYIYDVKHNKNIFYYGGGGCDREITISAKVSQPEKVYAMILFTRFWDKEGEGLTKWDSGRSMPKKGEGEYSVTLFSEKIPNYNAYEFAVMHYQIKAQDKAGNILAGTDVIKEVTLQICQ